MWCKNVGTTSLRFVTNHAFDGRTDSFLVATPRCMQCMQCDKTGAQLLLGWSENVAQLVFSI